MIKLHCEFVEGLKIGPKTILEIGSRDGDDAEYYRRRFNLISGNVHVVDANPLMITEIKKKYPNINIYNYAIHDGEDEVREFNQVVDGGKNMVGVSSLLDRNDNFYQDYKTKKISVNAISGSKLLEMIGMEIDICKIDVEGLTFEVLKSFGSRISSIKTLHIETEIEPVWKDQRVHTDVVRLLESLDFKMVWSLQYKNQYDSVWINNRSVVVNSNIRRNLKYLQWKSRSIGELKRLKLIRLLSKFKKHLLHS